MMERPLTEDLLRAVCPNTPSARGRAKLLDTASLASGRALITHAYSNLSWDPRPSGSLSHTVRQRSEVAQPWNGCTLPVALIRPNTHM